MTKLEYAQFFNMIGIAVIPLRHRGKEPASHMMGGTWEKYKSTLPTQYEVKNWLWSGWQNYGVVSGWNNLAILDFDDAESFAVWSDYFAMLNKHVEIFSTPFIVKTARGAHVYVTMPAGGNNSKRRGVDVKYHGYVVGPGCTHPSGAIYTAFNHSFCFPVVFDLETILPAELFPPVAVTEIVNPVIEMVFAPASQEDTEYEYDPFAVASGQVPQVDLITKVKQAVRIETMFADRRQTSIDGRWWSCKCVFHDDKRPSAWIDTRQQLYGCETCGMKPMDVINLYARQHHVSESIAVTELAKQVGVLA